MPHHSLKPFVPLSFRSKSSLIFTRPLLASQDHFASSGPFSIYLVSHIILWRCADEDGLMGWMDGWCWGGGGRGRRGKGTVEDVCIQQKICTLVWNQKTEEKLAQKSFTMIKWWIFCEILSQQSQWSSIAQPQIHTCWDVCLHRGCGRAHYKWSASNINCNLGNCYGWITRLGYRMLGVKGGEAWTRMGTR